MERKKISRDRLQNIAICLLFISAVALYARILGITRPVLAENVSAGEEVSALSLTELEMPLHMAVNNQFGRFGQPYTTSSAMGELGMLLGEALGTAGTPGSATNADVRAALAREGSAYFDFTVSVPLPVLSALLGGEASPGLSPLSARQFLLEPAGDAVRLFFWDESGCRVCSTSVSESALIEAAEDYQPNGALFAFEAGGDYAALEPYTLLESETPQRHILSATDPLSDDSGLLRALRFNPYTKNRYEESQGTQVIIENDRTLRITPEGDVFYLAGEGDDTFPVTAAGESPAATEAVSAAAALLASAAQSGEATLCLRAVEETETGHTLSFDYQYQGTVIRFADDVPAAHVSVSGGNITALTLRLRSYAATEESSLVLPVRQAAAIANSRAGTELILSYVDSGSERVDAAWLAG